MSTVIDQILRDKVVEIADAKARRPLAELEKMAVDAPPVRSFKGALVPSFGIIAEIKVKAPSRGDMRAENVQDAPGVYEKNPLVKAVSILTDRAWFGMSIEKLRDIRATLTKPVLRKDFILEEYQILEARAFGADAILLMANILDPAKLHSFHQLAKSLGMDVLFETHTAEQIASLPPDAEIYGINSRNFETKQSIYKASQLLGRLSSSARDLSTEDAKFDLIKHLPAHAVKVAESGVTPRSIVTVRDQGYNAALIGNSLLLAPEGVAQMLARFEEALA